METQVFWNMEMRTVLLSRKFEFDGEVCGVDVTVQVCSEVDR